ncbi:MAG: hypothetical protein AUH45_07500 [Gemmatimonadetes bacterium 13_1_40CM_69_22]|nr:MAG: hypothetical protein AUH45_07500 [Gemmatimonadetes bacterium 13_1_40CM_69_22]
MTEDRFEQLLRDAAQDYHRPPETPREELWRRIMAVREARRRRRVLVAAPWVRWGIGIAAVLALGIGIGRWTARPTGLGPAPIATAGASDQGALAYRVAAAQYLTRAEALLTGFRTETRVGQRDVQFAAQARDLLATTRLMLDSPAATDARLKGLLEDLELVLAQIAQLPPGGDTEDVQLINQGLEQHSVLLRLRTANPAGPGPVRTQGAL